MGIFHKKKNVAASQTAVLRIILEHAGTPLYELNTAEYTKEIIIGRAMDCGWTLDGIDSSASAKHAVISKRKNNFYITDLGSRNGIYFQNKRIKERKLVLGDKVSLGECTISVELVEEKNKRISQFHRLEYMDAKGHRTTIDVNKPQMLIGSSPDCDIIFQNQLISSQHAELLLRSDGSCWIRDLNSRNGTSVNGMELTMDGERMLQDNDVINIAYLEIRFLDAAVEHHDSKIWPTVITLAITALVIMAGYIGYMKLTPNSKQILKMAVTEINNGHFDKAKSLLDSSARAEGSENTKYEREQLARKIQLWENVIAMWKSVQNDLEIRNYNRAVQKLSSMNHDDLNAWTWPQGAVEKKKAIITKKLLDACSSSSAILKNEHASIEDVKMCRDELVQAISEASQVKMASIVQVIKDAQPLLHRVEKTLNDDNELQATLSLLSNRQPDYNAIISRLQKISTDSGGPVKARADKILPAILTLHRETQRMLVMVDKVGEMDFKSVNDFRLDLPESIDWSTEKNIGSLRRNLIETVERFKDVSLQLFLIHKNLVNKGVIIGKNIPDLESFLNNKDLEAVYAFDSLNMPLPKNSRQEPAGKYDELLGIEFFYDYVSNIHTQSTTLNVDELPFKPKLYKAREIILEIEKFIRFANKDENQWFNRGQFANYLEHCQKILSLRNKIVDAQLKRNAAIGSREFIVSRGVASYLLPDGEKQRTLSKDVEQSFSAFKRTILKLNREYNIAMPEDALKIRGQIIKTGLPGDPIVKKMWQQRPAAGWGDL